MRSLVTTVALLALTALPAAAQDRLIPLDGGAARVSRGTAGRPLTGPSPASRGQIIADFLRGRHDPGTLDTLVLSKDDASGGAEQHVAFGQRIGGLDIYGTYVRASMTARGELLDVIENLVPARALRPARIGPDQALAAVLARFYPGAAVPAETGSAGNTTTYARGPLFDEPPAVTRVAVPLQGSVLDTGYLVVTWDRGNTLRHTVVSGSGQIVGEELRTSADSYRIFPIDPGKGSQVDVVNPADGTASPSGWVAGSTTVGNNVDAYLDRDNNNAADSSGRPVNADKNFLFTFDTAAAPTTTTNQMAAVTNLFYLNNLLHDRLYSYGFDEVAGNFQTDNFGRGGAGSDPVNAEAQDGGGTNNANFSTPADGSRPRMQMYLWNKSTPNRDGDVDSDVVYHEYGHGLTWRMIGNMNGPFAGAIGEGMSDVLAIYFNDNDRVGEYVANNPIGIRRDPYTNYPRTYGSITGNSVHADGEIYAATLWRLRQNWLAAGLDETRLRKDIVNGMNYTPSRPQNEDMRDGILAAMTARSASSAEACHVWEAFAHFGVGVGANGTESCFVVICSISVTESFAMPSSCSASTNTPPAVAITSPANNTHFVQGATVTVNATANDTQDGSLTGGITWTIDGVGVADVGGSISRSNLTVGSHTFVATATDSGTLSGSASVTVIVDTAPPPAPITLTATKSKVKGLNVVTLAWSGATGSVDVFRGTTRLVTTAATSYTDNTGTKGGQTFTYKVCEAAAATVCSNTVTVVF